MAIISQKEPKHGFFPKSERNQNKPTKNYTKLCKTNPNSEKSELTHTLLYKGLMKIFSPFGHQKTNPKRTQTKPNSEMAKMNAYAFIQRTYDEIHP